MANKPNVTLTINATGPIDALVKVLRQVADELEATTGEAHGIARVLSDGDGAPLGEVSIKDED